MRSALQWMIIRCSRILLGILATSTVVRVVSGNQPRAEKGRQATSAAVSPRTFEVARLSASDGAAEHRFGKSLAVDGDIIAVAGDSVHVFRRVGATWVEEAKIRHPDWRRADFSSVGVPPPSPKTCSRSPPKPAATSIGGGMASTSSGSLCVPSSNSAASTGCGRT